MKSQIIHKITTIKKVVANNLIDNGIYAKSRPGKFTIVMYHGVDRKQDTHFNERFFSVANFDKQIAGFKKHFNVLTYDDFLHNRFSKDKPNMLITFDDGYANNVNYALPVLDKHNAHALFFVTGVGTMNKKILWADALDIVTTRADKNSKVTMNGAEFRFDGTKFACKELNIDLASYVQASKKTGYVEKENLVTQLLSIYDFTADKDMDDYWHLMTDDQILRASQSKNITIGSHGFYHNNLGSLANDDAVNEVRLSKKYLENIIQKDVTSIGFPDGSYTEQLNDSLNAEGFKKQFLVDYRYGDNNKRNYAHDRYGLYPSTGNNHRILYKLLNQ